MGLVIAIVVAGLLVAVSALAGELREERLGR